MTSTKFKTSWEWTVSALRGTGRGDVGDMQNAVSQMPLGQRVWKPGAPVSWDDVAASWTGSDALLRQAKIAQRLAAPLGETVDACILASRIMSAPRAPQQRNRLRSPKGPAGGITPMLVSPTS
jgi:uncharacterized protein (DUF1800 family)